MMKHKKYKRYLLSPKEYPLPNTRIDGFKKLQEVNARTVEVLALAPKVFDLFNKTGKLPSEFIKELRLKVKKIIATSRTKSVVVRRAYVVPGLTNPPGPRFLGLKAVKKVMRAVKEIFTFAKSQGFNKQKNSQISGIIYSFIDPPKLDKKNLGTAALPYGGYAIVTGAAENEIEIYAVFGNNEGVQSLVADRYFIIAKEENKYFITKKEIVQKTQMICTTKDSQSELLNVPSEKQFEQILSDNEILEVSRVAHQLSRKYGSQRIEFSADEIGILFNEAVDYWKETLPEISSYNVQGEVVVINSIRDLEKLRKINEKFLDSGKKIVVIGKHIIENREYDILGTLASWKTNLVILYPGVAATQHAMRVLTDKGHRTFLVGTQKFQEGDMVKISAVGTKVRITNLSETATLETISLWDASLFGIELCGGKAYRLSRLKVAGFRVPHGLVITTKIFDQVMQIVGGKTPLTLTQFKNLYASLAKLAAPLQEKIQQLLSDYIASGKSFSTRSSGTIEDTAKVSMAGMFESVIGVSGKKLVPAAIKVIQSTFALKILTYLKDKPELISQLKMAVVIQEMVDAKTAGVIFGAQVQTRNLDIVEIEAVKGLGEKIVSGAAKEIERFQFSRSERWLIKRTGQQILSLEQAKALFMLSERLRTEFNDVPQDIEWAIDRNEQIWILQSRDLII